jgi:hypothetical protein
MKRLVFATLLFTSCASAPPVEHPPASSPDRCFAIAGALCRKVAECTDKSQVAEGECLQTLEPTCQDASGITDKEMTDCVAGIRAAACTDSLPAVCLDIAESAARTGVDL